MPKITVKNIAGKNVKELELKDSIWSVPANDTLLHQVYVAQKGNARQVVAHTKDRSERAGSNIKPWRQKGTGRARAGTKRSPLWRKGGVTFGPTKDRNWNKNTNKKMRQKATMIALSGKLRSGKMIVLDTLNYPEKKTKLFSETLNVLGIAGKSAVFCMTGSTERAYAIMSRNIPKLENTPTENLNVSQILDREYLIMTEAGVKNLEGRFVEWDKEKIKDK
jgi:large subunit ribosomal protein L4